MRISKVSAALSMLAALLVAPVFADASATISFNVDTVYPEGMDWSATQQRFYIGSVRHGTLGTIDMDGHYKLFAQASGIPSTFGIRVDDNHQRLWVTANDLGASEHSSAQTQGKLAEVRVFDLRNGQQLAQYDLNTMGPGPHLANDVTLDPQGNAYISDSFAHAIYRVDTSGRLAPFASSPMFETGEAFGLNGIAYHPNGYLLAGAWNSGELFRISVSNPTEIRRVKLPVAFIGMDGFTLRDPKHLIASVNVGSARAVELSSDDEWLSASLVSTQATVSSFPTAVAVGGATVWVLNSRLDTLIDPNAAKVSTFYLEQYAPGASSGK